MTDVTKIQAGANRFWGPLSRLGVLLAAWVFGLDQLSKFWILKIVNLDERPPIQITPFADLAMAWNEGVSYGLLTTNAQMVLVVMSLVITAVLWIWLARAAHPLSAAALGLIIGGALGNVLDRLIYGAVADFFSFHAFGFYWYIFNVADVWIAVGVGLILIESFFPTLFAHRGEENSGSDGPAGSQGS